MKIPSAVLAKKIREVKGFVPTKTPMAVLQSLLIKEGYIIASNTEMTVMVKLEGAEGISETFLLPPKAYAILANMTLGDTEIKSDAKFQLTITSGKSKSRFASTDPSQYSFEINRSYADKHEAVIDAELLKATIARCMFAVDEKTAANTVMEAISLKAKDGILNVCGMSRAQLAWNKVEYDGEMNILLPISAAQKLLSLNLQGDVHIYDDKKVIIFATDDCIFQSRLIQGEFVDYVGWFNDLSLWAEIDRMDMISVMSRIATLAQNENQPVRLEFSKDECRISYMSAEASYDETILLAQPIGSADPVVIGLNPKLLLDMMKAYPGDDVVLNLEKSSMPMLVSDEVCQLRSMLLPVQIRA